MTTHTVVQAASQATPRNLLELFRKTASEITERELPAISESTVISELGIDSLGMLEIVGWMGRELSVQLPDEALAGIQTVKDLIELVEKKQSLAVASA